MCTNELLKLKLKRIVIIGTRMYTNVSDFKRDIITMARYNGVNG